MSTQLKAVLAALIAAVMAVGVYGGYKYLLTPPLQVSAGTAAAGSTFNTAKTAAIAMVFTNGATSTSILNTDASDRFVISNFIACSSATSTYTAVTGAGLANWIIKAATTSTNAPAVISNTNLVMNDTVATGTVGAGVASDYGGIALVASSSIATTSPTGWIGNAAGSANQFRWATGTYLTYWSNATNTAACTVGVYYLPS